MTIFWTVVTVIAVLVVLAVTHIAAWVKGFESGRHCAKLEELNERTMEMKAARLSTK